MNMKIKNMVFSFFYIIIVYIILWQLVFLILGDTDEVLLFGITIASGKAFPNIKELIIWNFVSIIPIACVQILFYFRCSTYIYLSLIRYASTFKWHINNLFTFLFVIVCWYVYGGIIASNSNRKLMIIALCLNIIYSYSIVLLGISVYLICKNVKAIIAVYILISTVSLGFYREDAINRFVYGFFGMINRSDYVNKVYGFNTKSAIIAMFILIIINIFFQYIYLKINKIDKMEE